MKTGWQQMLEELERRKTARYQVVREYPGYWVIDTTKDDGENCAVGGSYDKDEADRMCSRLNGWTSDEENSDE